MIGLIGAMTKEIDGLLADLQDARSVQVGPFELWRGRLETHLVLVARCGIGKVNAAALTQTMLVQGVTKLIFTGVAGALQAGLKVGDIVVSSDAVQHDVDATAFGYALGEIPGEPFAWKADDALQRAALQAAEGLEGVRVVSGRILSGDQFIASKEKVAWLLETFQGACTEMEGAAVAQVCAKWGVPFVIVRSVSDSADGDAEVSFETFMPTAAARANTLVREMLKLLERPDPATPA